MQSTDTAEDTQANRNSMICPCCLQFVEDGGFMADAATGVIANNGKDVRLTDQQFRLAKFILDRYPLMASKEAIYDGVFMASNGEGPDIKIVDVLICKIRPALAEIGLVIETVWGKGYRIIEADPSQGLSIKDRSLRNRAPGSMTRWTPEHDETLLGLMHRKMSVTACAAIMKMPYMAVERHYRKLRPLLSEAGR